MPESKADLIQACSLVAEARVDKRISFWDRSGKYGWLGFRGR